MSYEEGYKEGILYSLEALDEILYDWEGSSDELLQEITKLKLELANIYHK